MLIVKLAYKWIDDMFVFSKFCVGSIFKDEIQVFNFNKTLITHVRYTGEDGVEISILSAKTREVTEAILDSKSGIVRPAGLGARDSLRLEAGLCLYGNDIDETTSPIEAGLAWTIGKRLQRKHFSERRFEICQ
jgi:glycine cleavage system aminomethyltransferase T